MNVAIRQRRVTDDYAGIIERESGAIIATQSPQTRHDAVGVEESLCSGINPRVISHGRRTRHLARVVDRVCAARRAAQSPQIKKRGPIKREGVRGCIALELRLAHDPAGAIDGKPIAETSAQCAGFHQVASAIDKRMARMDSCNIEESGKLAGRVQAVHLKS